MRNCKVAARKNVEWAEKKGYGIIFLENPYNRGVLKMRYIDNTSGNPTPFQEDVSDTIEGMYGKYEEARKLIQESPNFLYSESGRFW